MSAKGTILLKFSAGRPQFRKLDKALTAETQNRNMMSDDSGNFNKCLIPKNYFDKWDKTITMLRTKFYELTSPWDDSGYRICTPDAFWKFQRAWAEHENVLESFRDDFLMRYDDIRQQQKRRLGSAFDPDEYPPAVDIAPKFRFETDVAQVPEKGNLAASLGEEEEARVVARVEERMLEAHKENYRRLFEAVSHLAKTAGDEKKLKHCKSSTLENVRKMVELIPALNFMDDPGLADLADSARKLCDDMTMEELKKGGDELRTHVHQTASATAEHIETMMELYA